MLRKTLLTGLAFALFAATASAHEPGGFNGKLYAAEVAIGLSLALIPVGFGFLRWYAADSGLHAGYEKEQRDALYITITYPTIIGLVPFLVGEIWGTSSENKAACYAIPTAVSFGIMGAAASIGSTFTGEAIDGAMIGAFISVVPNAFLTAYLYNIVKKPKEDPDKTSLTVRPYFTALREPSSEGDLTLLCGVAASF